MNDTHLSFEELNIFSGSYQSETSTRILIIAGNQRLTYLEPSTGHYRVFRRLLDDSFTAGPGFKQPEPIEVTAQFVRNSAGDIAELVWTHSEKQQMLDRSAAFTYEDIAFRNGDILLSGRLTQPVTASPYPATVMIHGSGPVPRQEFQPLAEFFASIGIAVLTYDKRGVGDSTGQWQSASYQALAEDALAGVRYLQSRADINATEIGMWGISQGGWLVLLAASLSKDVKFIIPVSGPGVNPIEQEIWRVEHMLKADGFSSSDIETAVNLRKRGFAVWQHGESDWRDFIFALERARHEPWFNYLGIDANPNKDDFVNEPGWILEPVPILKQVSCPVLAIFGELDPFLPVQQSATNFRQALKIGGNQDYEVTIIPKGNHVIFDAVTGSPQEQPNLPGFVPEYLALMRDWLLERVTVKQ